MIHHLLVAAALASWAIGPGAPAAPVANIEYDLTFTRTTAATRSVGVTMRFEATAAGPVRLSLPTWTPGAYEISNFAKRVSGFRATAGTTELDWDKTDPDTWRVEVQAAGPVAVRFAFAADVLDNAAVWAKADFTFINGTNVFLYPEDTDLGFAAQVSVTTESDWAVATGMTPAGRHRFRAANYHDLVDMPVFIGRFDLDSAMVDRKMHRVASYPAGALAGAARKLFWNQLERAVPAMSKVFGETPFDHYTTLLVFDPEFGGGSALEHQNSHLGIYSPEFIGTPILASITAHEIYHVWNVKRLRPADLVPYRYDQPQPTTLLWVSEGITDYYADLALVRGGVIDSAAFLDLTLEKLREVAGLPPVALEDASLSTWIQPTDGTGTIYYPKGSLAGFLLDVLIRDGTDNRASLDDLMRTMYQRTFKAGRGFTDADWWKAAEELSGRKDLADFATRYIYGREPFPYARVAPLAGIRYVADSIREPRIGVGTTGSETGVQIVTNVVPDSPAAQAGIQLGDELITVGEVKVDPNFGALYRARYRQREGEKIPVTLKRAGRDLTVTMTVRHAVRVDERLEFDRRAILKPARIRAGLLRGTTER
jgi:predicted metalloprotease with PDZ domain